MYDVYRKGYNYLIDLTNKIVCPHMIIAICLTNDRYNVALTSI